MENPKLENSIIHLSKVEKQKVNLLVNYIKILGKETIIDSKNISYNINNKNKNNINKASIDYKLNNLDVKNELFINHNKIYKTNILIMNILEMFIILWQELRILEIIALILA